MNNKFKNIFKAWFQWWTVFSICQRVAVIQNTNTSETMCKCWVKVNYGFQSTETGHSFMSEGRFYRTELSRGRDKNTPGGVRSMWKASRGESMGSGALLLLLKMRQNKTEQKSRGLKNAGEIGWICSVTVKKPGSFWGTNPPGLSIQFYPHSAHSSQSHLALKKAKQSFFPFPKVFYSWS